MTQALLLLTLLAAPPPAPGNEPVEIDQVDHVSTLPTDRRPAPPARPASDRSADGASPSDRRAGDTDLSPNGSIPLRPRSGSAPRPSARRDDAERGNPDATGATNPEDDAIARQRLVWWGATGGLLGVALIVSWFFRGALRRAMPGLIPGAADFEAPVGVLHRSWLSPKHQTCLLRVGDRLLLVGIAGDRMQTLCEISDPAEADALRGRCQQQRPESSSRMFRDLFTAKGKAWERSDLEEPPPPRAPSVSAARRPEAPGVDHPASGAGPMRGDLRDRVPPNESGRRPDAAPQDMKARLMSWRARLGS
jgi:flagellar biogenesis protein FliO